MGDQIQACGVHGLEVAVQAIDLTEVPRKDGLSPLRHQRGTPRKSSAGGARERGRKESPVQWIFVSRSVKRREGNGPGDPTTGRPSRLGSMGGAGRGWVRKRRCEGG